MAFQKTKLNPVIILLLWSIGLRFLVYLFLPVSDDLGRYGNSGELYFSALTTHFRDYVSFTTNIPPGTFFIQAAVLGLLGLKLTMQVRAMLILLWILNISAILLLFNAAKQLGTGTKISFWLFCLLSAAMVPVELWRDGMHYDHYTFFFTSLFAWSLVRTIKKGAGSLNSIYIACSGALLVLQSAANSAIVPAAIVLILMLLLVPQKKYGKWMIHTLISLSLPFFVLVIISRKNQTEAGESLTSNKAGPAMMMVVQRAYGYDVAKIRELAQNSGAPDWYLWTYDHATAPIDPATGSPAKGWINLAQAFGICFYPQSGIGKGPWQFEFDSLITYLVQQRQEKLVTTVQADADDAINKPYRYAGFSPELSPRWIGIYGTVSKKIFFSALAKNPWGMIKASVEQAGIFSLYGPLFPYNTTQHRSNFLARSGLRTLHDPIPFNIFFIFAVLLFAVIAFVTFFLVIINLPVTAWKIVKGNMETKKILLQDPFLLLSIPALGVALVFSCLVGGENDRYFMQLVPYLMLLTALIPFRLRGKIIN